MARSGRIGLWVLVAAGPLLGMAALSAASGRPAESAPASPAPPAVLAAAAHAVGVFVAADEPDDLVAMIGEAAAAQVDPAGAEPTVVLPAAAEPDGSGWLVTVAVTGDDGSAAWYAVTVSSGERDGAWRTVGSPGRVDDPAGLEMTSAVLPAPPPGDARLVTAEAWLRAWLTADGDVERFSAPGLSVTAMSPAPYESLRVTGFDESGPDVAPVVSVSVLAEAGGFVEPLTYRLRLSGRDGRWEVAELFPTITPAISEEQPS